MKVFASVFAASMMASGLAFAANCTNANSSLSPFAAGNGSEDDPYLICSVTQYNKIATSPSYLDKNFEIGKNLDFAYAPMVQIGSLATPFSGSLDGRNKTLKNLFFKARTSDAFYVGMFRAVSGATIRRLKIDGVKNEAGSGYAFGTVAGSAVDAKFESIKIENMNTIMGDFSGALAGMVDDSELVRITVSSSSFSSLDSADAVGGLVGKIADSCVSKSKADVDNIFRRGNWAVSCIGGAFGVMTTTQLHKLKVYGAIKFQPESGFTLADYTEGKGFGSVAGCGDKINMCGGNPVQHDSVDLSTVMGVAQFVGKPIGRQY